MFYFSFWVVRKACKSCRRTVQKSQVAALCSQGSQQVAMTCTRCKMSDRGNVGRQLECLGTSVLYGGTKPDTLFRPVDCTEGCEVPPSRALSASPTWKPSWKAFVKQYRGHSSSSKLSKLPALAGQHCKNLNWTDKMRSAKGKLSASALKLW